VSENGHRRITLEDGNWVEMTTELTGRDFIIIMEFDSEDASKLPDLLRVIERHTVEHSFGGEILDQKLPVLTKVFSAWNRAEEDDAVPPASGGESAPPSTSQPSAPAAR
jgi:hypothetical protein